MKCIIGAWANTKCTRPVSSFILALAFWGTFMAFTYAMGNPADLSIWIFAGANVLFFPLALRITVFVLLNFMAVPLGALGFFYLATQEAKGNGYRVIA